MHLVIDPKAKYKLKWNVPLNDVDIIEYGPGVNILTNSYRTTISHSKEGLYIANNIFSHSEVTNVHVFTSRVNDGIL